MLTRFPFPRLVASTAPSLELALPLLTSAIRSYTALSAYKAWLHALQLYASVLDALGRTAERDAAAAEWVRVRDDWDTRVVQGEGMRASIEEVRLVANGVMEVGIAISLGRI